MFCLLFIEELKVKGYCYYEDDEGWIVIDVYINIGVVVRGFFFKINLVI